MGETKGSILRFSIAFALSNVRLRIGRSFAELGLSEDQRYEAADRTLSKLRRHDQWKELDEPVEPKHDWVRNHDPGFKG